MDLLDEIRAEVRGSGSTCKAGEFIRSLDDEKREAVATAIAEHIDGAAIGRWLKKQGFGYSSESVSRHLAGRCKCQR